MALAASDPGTHLLVGSHRAKKLSCRDQPGLPEAGWNRVGLLPRLSVGAIGASLSLASIEKDVLSVPAWDGMDGWADDSGFHPSKRRGTRAGLKPESHAPLTGIGQRARHYFPQGAVGLAQTVPQGRRSRSPRSLGPSAGLPPACPRSANARVDLTLVKSLIYKSVFARSPASATMSCRVRSGGNPTSLGDVLPRISLLGCTRGLLLGNFMDMPLVSMAMAQLCEV